MSGRLRLLIVKYKVSLIQFLKFNSIGIINTLLDMALLALFTSAFHMNAYLANTISYFTGMTNSFLMNKFWTFKKKEQRFTGMEVMRFVVVNLISYAAQQGMLFLLLNILGLHPPILGKVIVTPVSLVINFFLYKFWIFRNLEK